MWEFLDFYGLRLAKNQQKNLFPQMSSSGINQAGIVWSLRINHTFFAGAVQDIWVMKNLISLLNYEVIMQLLN